MTYKSISSRSLMLAGLWTEFPVDRPGTLPAPPRLSKKQLRAFEMMNDALRKKALEIRQLLEDPWFDFFRAGHDLNYMDLEDLLNPHVDGTMADTATQPDSALVPDPLSPSPIERPGTLPAPPGLTEAQLREKLLELSPVMEDERVTRLRSCYALGSIVLEVRQNAHVYGTMSDMLLAGFLDDEFEWTTCQDARRIRERYSPERFERLVSAVNPETGFRLGYDDRVTLLRITDDAEADRILEDVIPGSLNM